MVRVSSSRRDASCQCTGLMRLVWRPCRRCQLLFRLFQQTMGCSGDLFETSVWVWSPLSCYPKFQPELNESWSCCRGHCRRWVGGVFPDTSSPSLKLVLHLSKRLDSCPPTLLSHLNITTEEETLLSFKFCEEEENEVNSAKCFIFFIEVWGLSIISCPRNFWEIFHPSSWEHRVGREHGKCPCFPGYLDTSQARNLNYTKVYKNLKCTNTYSGFRGE